MAKNDTEKEPVPEATEGVRSFARFTEQISDGEAHAILSDKLHETMAVLREHADRTDGDVKGELTVKYTFKVSPSGTVQVAQAIATKLPKERPTGGTFWLTPGNNLSPENPKQMKLGLKKVPTPPSREAEPATQKAREA